MNSRSCKRCFEGCKRCNGPAENLCSDFEYDDRGDPKPGNNDGIDLDPRNYHPIDMLDDKKT